MRWPEWPEDLLPRDCALCGANHVDDPSSDARNTSRMELDYLDERGEFFGGFQMSLCRSCTVEAMRWIERRKRQVRRARKAVTA